MRCLSAVLNINILCESAVYKVIYSVLSHTDYAVVQVRNNILGHEIQKPVHRAFTKPDCNCPEKGIRV